MNSQQVVGDFFEKKLMKMFNLLRLDEQGSGGVFDLMARDGSFFMEAKGSAYDNGGVVKEKQLLRFNEVTGARRFYAFAYHPISTRVNMTETYRAENKLRQALDLKSLYIFPFSIVKAYLETTKKRASSGQPAFVQIDENLAGKIFEADEEVWKRLGLRTEDYETILLSEKVKLMTRGSYLQAPIRCSFNRDQ